MSDEFNDFKKLRELLQDPVSRNMIIGVGLLAAAATVSKMVNKQNIEYAKNILREAYERGARRSKRYTSVTNYADWVAARTAVKT